MKRSMAYAAAALLALTAVSFAGDRKGPDEELIQIAILLDASNSMDGLIGQAKSQLWKIVNEFALAKRSGKTPRLEVAFYEYGKSSLPSAEGYIRRIVPLTTDLDRLSDELFKLTTRGGQEYCGHVIRRAVEELSWSGSSRVMKAIFIAGNEAFTQGKVDYKKSCRDAIAKGIVVNTIFCGSEREGINTKWKEGADLADGSFMNIDQNRQIVHVKAPQDSAIMALGRQLNATYIGYGSAGHARKSMQEKQDRSAAAAAPAAMVQRSVAKASVMYDNAEWDLVDAKKEKKLDVAQLAEEQLPDEMKDMKPQEREAYVEKKSAERAGLQAKISTLNQERRKYVAEEQKKTSADNTLDRAIITAVRKEAVKKGYQFDSK
ncbi:MAG: VWA domain-containing protein [Chitinispirillaceae bacterium]|nr:VWA domain-containing protein [Chitinispirillaceae bacterium]